MKASKANGQDLKEVYLIVENDDQTIRLSEQYIFFTFLTVNEEVDIG